MPIAEALLLRALAIVSITCIRAEASRRLANIAKSAQVRPIAGDAEAPRHEEVRKEEDGAEH
jgi:hypothetical protein